MALGHIGSFKGTAGANINLIDVLENDIKNKHPNCASKIHQLSIEAPAGETIVINGVDIIIPASGILQFGFDLISFNSLVFNKNTDVNIVYIY